MTHFFAARRCYRSGLNIHEYNAYPYANNNESMAGMNYFLNIETSNHEKFSGINVIVFFDLPSYKSLFTTIIDMDCFLIKAVSRIRRGSHY